MTQNPPNLYYSICIIFLSSVILYLQSDFFLNKNSNSENLKMPPKVPMNVQSFPRPPLIERTSRHLQIKWRGQLIADTKEAYWVLETYHPPTYYLPPSSVLVPLVATKRSTFCEWKGWAKYYSITTPKGSEGEEETVRDRIWTYENPTERFAALKDHLSFYAGPWQCYVDGEEVKPQPGDFYGGWVTSELEGLIKGSKETRHL
ncbi:hypothetical protein HYFRA_00001732 [Hymenoscyphus fraxineus]|uniref:DUF427 domain-containing protein n=1 Tax=Hymenoscyphus fraxineus TaxID=746836 RepID=A0A9N9PMN0_9HELO|nr:hypothetical protein HYFRA_00001732 [Hymenoscyphus fraxineus]